MSEIKLTIDGTEYEMEAAISLMKKDKTPILHFEGVQFIGKAIPKEVKPIDYEILQYFYKTNKTYFSKCLWGDADFKDIPEKYGDSVEISSVKRLSDSEVFCIGDETPYGNIEKFHIGWDGIEVHFTNGSGATLRSIEKVKPKQKLFTTEEGTGKFEGDDCLYVNTENWDAGVSGWYHLPNPLMCEGITDFSKYKFFHTKEEAKRYLLHNKPIQVSLTEIEEILRSVADNTTGYNNKSYLREKFSSLFASKI